MFLRASVITFVLLMDAACQPHPNLVRGESRVLAACTDSINEVAVAP